MRLEIILHDKVGDFVQELPEQAKAKVFWSIELLKEFGLAVGRPYVAPVQDRIWELRVAHKGNRYRFLFFIAEGAAVLVHGFLKKTPRVPKRDLDLAISRMKEYLLKKGGPKR